MSTIASIGLGDFGKPDGFLERQVERWLAELDSYSKSAAYTPLPLTLIDPIASWLRANQPAHWSPGFLHGDFHIANVMFEQDSATIAAIVDWEMSTIGDPLLDLGWLVASWPENPGEPDMMASAYAKAGGLPVESELIERYAATSTRDLSALDWYVVLGCFKLAIILDGTFSRSVAGKADVQTGIRLRTISEGLLLRAVRRIESL